MLADSGSIPAAVWEVRRYLDNFSRIVAVVSAFKNHTDALEKSALELNTTPEPETLAYYLGLGEMRAVGELALGLQHAGIHATFRLPWDVGMVSEGSPLDATPVALSKQAFLTALAQSPVVVFPGYVSRGREGTPHVLGRGGSDLTAIFLAAELNADRCILLKDAPGIFEWDPARDGHEPRRYRYISWDDAARVGGRMLRHSHVDYARSRSVTVEVTALGASVSTIVGAHASEFDESVHPEKSRRTSE